jgi:16S rRNA (uracil1498-N3)-methyltransferase
VATVHCFFLSDAAPAGRARLAPDDAQHARRVLRLAVGDAALGLDGRGGRWPLRMVALERGEPVFECSAAPSREPAPGEPGSKLPWIEVAVSLPRGARAEEMLDRLVQLGVAAVRPLITERTQGFARELSAGRSARLERIVREACKQSRRAWLPELLPATEVAGLAELARDGATCVLAPEGAESLLDWTRNVPRGTRAAPWRVVVGAEGGLSDAEVRGLAALGAPSVCMGPNILRIETAAEAAVAVLVQAALAQRAD